MFLKALLQLERHKEAESELLAIAACGTAPQQLCVEAISAMLEVEGFSGSILSAMSMVLKRAPGDPQLPVRFVELCLCKSDSTASTFMPYSTSHSNLRKTAALGHLKSELHNTGDAALRHLRLQALSLCRPAAGSTRAWPWTSFAARKSCQRCSRWAPLSLAPGAPRTRRCLPAWLPAG